MDIERVRQLVELMKEHELTELSIKDGQTRIVLRRGPGEQPIIAAPMPAAPAPVVPTSPPAAPEPPQDDSLVAIPSPMVGTFYTAPDPESPAYVKVGGEVDPDTVVCIVEAMKVFNEIKAEVAGTVEKVCVQNAQPVEFGQQMFMVRLRK